MFRATFLGHQGWLFSSGDSHLLVDPLLTEDFADTGNVGAVFPPRVLDRAALPPITAVLFTHEHNDHFAVSTLARIDRRVPIFFPARSSIACRTIAAEMGFRVFLVGPGSVVDLPDLECRLFGADHVQAENSDEWEVLPFLVRDKAGHGSLFTHVDVETSPALEARVRAVAGRVGLWVYTNNLTDWSFLRAGNAIEAPPRDTAWLTAWILEHHGALKFRGEAPAGILLAGGGFAFEGDRAWLNRNVFRADSEQAAAALAVLLADTLVAAPLPGESMILENGVARRGDPHAPFLRARERDTWPSRAYVGDVSVLDSYAPACGREEVADAAIAEIEAHLDRFAAQLYGGRLFRALYSIDPAAIGSRAATFSVVLRTERGGALVYEYDPSGCRFVPAQREDPVNDYVSGIELWGSDFLAVARGELDVMGITFGRGRFWNADPKIVDLSFGDLWMYFHPLRHPAIYLRLYRARRAQLGDVPIDVRAGEGRASIRKAVHGWEPVVNTTGSRLG